MEEFTLVGYEMQWTVRYFLYQAGIWKDRGVAAGHSGKVGAVAYAARKAAMWRSMAASSDRQFRIVNDRYTPLIL